MKSRFFCILLSLLLIMFLPMDMRGQKCVSEETPESWAENTMKSLSIDQKIAQLLMIRVHSDWSEKELKAVYNQISKYGVGGVCFFSGTPLKQVSITNHIQKISSIPVLVSIDGEWGPSMRLDKCAVFPHQMTMGALPAEDDHLIFEFGEEVASQCRALGIHINFAPCVDVNSNAQNPVINSRSFGEVREEVARKALAYMHGMQLHGLSACAKHFPGHGDTQVDSHSELPVILKSWSSLDSLELYPFRELIRAGVDMVMVSHLNVPALNDTSFSIATLSYKVITDLLRNELNFQGIVVTDGLDMKGVRNSYPTIGDAEVLALLAGCDILLLPGDLDKVITTIKSAVHSGQIPEKLIDEKCLRVLTLKYSKGLAHFKPLDTDHLYSVLNSPKADAIITQMQQDALTLVRNRSQILPFPEDTTTVLFCIGSLSDSLFLKDLASHYHIGYMQVPKSVEKKDYVQILDQLASYRNVIVAVLQTSQYLKNQYGVTQEMTDFLSVLPNDKSLALSYMGNPYGLEKIGDLEPYGAIAVGYQYNKNTMESMIAAVMGRSDFEGHLPVSVAGFPVKTEGHYRTIERTEKNTNISRLSSYATAKIDSMVQHAIDEKIIPGCQILAMRKDTIVFAKNYGYLTYENIHPVNDATMYDVASMTKPLATTLAMMRLYEEGYYNLNDKIGKYLDYLAGTDKEKITIAELLTHTSGLSAFIPFYKEISSSGKWVDGYLQKESTGNFTIVVADSVYLRSDFPSIVRKRIAKSKLGEKKYVYSDLNFILLKDIVEKLSGMSLDDYLMENFYLPLGLERTRFNPWKYIDKANIAPTEEDDYFRNQLIQGYVHDQSAAVLGGVGGNAGLFSTAHDVSVLLSMLMHGGQWQGKRYFMEKTVHHFVTTHPMHGCARRSYGFDTPSFAQKNPVLPVMAQKHTYGHQGFTGTVFWCDPDEDLIYVFLSNRVYPDAEPNKLSKSRLRLLVHEVIYQDLAD